MNDLPLAHKVVVIIGGTSGIGLSGAKACIRAGATVIAVGHDPAQEPVAKRELGEGGVVLTRDAMDPETARKAVQLAVMNFGRLHGLYHVAGGSGRRWGDAALHEVTDEGWERTLQLNLTSMMYSNRAAVNQFFSQQSGGSILNVSSVLSYSPAPKYFGTIAYATAKGAILAMTRAAAYYRRRIFDLMSLPRR